MQQAQMIVPHVYQVIVQHVLQQVGILKAIYKDVHPLVHFQAKFKFKNFNLKIIFKENILM